MGLRTVRMDGRAFSRSALQEIRAFLFEVTRLIQLDPVLSFLGRRMIHGRGGERPAQWAASPKFGGTRVLGKRATRELTKGLGIFPARDNFGL